MSVATLTPSAPGRMQMVLPLALVSVVLLMVVPLPPWLLDLLLVASMALSVALLLIAIRLENSLDLSSLPTILLFSTLLRLSLNVASTRLILLHGDQGADAAGKVIQSFGEFIVGGNYIVGATVFLILVIVNFVVITKGAGRIAEVSARFALDSMPGKQMSIDADLSAGAITQDEARRRRKEVEQESDFFGAMDGASKFVRGDAVAGLLMTAINIIVGFIIGIAQHGMSLADAASTYTILTVGDGLSAQVPALLVSTAAGVVVTRAAAGAALGPAMMAQLRGHRPALQSTAGVLTLAGLLPGMPLVPFWALAGVLAWTARQQGSTSAASTPALPGEASPAKKEAPNEKAQLEQLLDVDLLQLEVGFDLVPMVNTAQGGELVERVAAIRRSLAADLGILVPSIHIRDNLRLDSSAYRLLLSGNEVGSGKLRARKFLAMDPTGKLPPIAGEEVREPAFGLPARWIQAGQREQAEKLGYTVVDTTTVATTHLTEMLKSLAPDLLGRHEAQELVDLLAKKEPRLVDEVVPNLLPFGEVVKVLRNLLREGVPVRDLRSIFEALADHARDTKQIEELTECTRRRLGRHISQRFRDPQGQIAALVLDPSAEEQFRREVLDAGAAQRILRSLDQAASAFSGLTTPPLMLCAADVRPIVARFIGRRIPGLSVMSFAEVDPKATVRTLAVVTA